MQTYALRSVLSSSVLIQVPVCCEQVIAEEQSVTHKPIFLAYTIVLAFDALAGALLLPPR